MAGQSEKFTRALASRLSELLGEEFAYLRSRDEFRRESPGGRDVVLLSVNSKYSPAASVAFYFGRNFDVARKVEKQARDGAFLYHVQQYSANRAPLFAPGYVGPDTWSVDLESDAESIAQDLAAAIRGMAFPFFDRFASAEVARDAISTGDPFCFSGMAYWRQLLLLDVALGDLEHFDAWATSLDDRTRDQARAQIEKYRAAGVAGV